MLLLIDNYDSFTYNLYQMLSQLGQEVLVYRNDELTINDIQNMAPDRIVISPGPGTPDDAGISCEVIRSLGGKLPILGVCLGMQCIGQVFGGKIVNAGELLHGKTSLIYHTGKGVFRNIPSPFEAVRYHSLVVDKSSISDELEVVAQTSNGLVMGLRHKNMPIEGVQFHPESVLTEYGSKILANFLNVDLKESLQLIGA